MGLGLKYGNLKANNIYMEKQVFDLLKIASSLIEQGLSTIDTAFVDAINLQNYHMGMMLKAQFEDSAPERREPTGYTEVYLGVISEMAIKVYSQINAKKIV